MLLVSLTALLPATRPTVVRDAVLASVDTAANKVVGVLALVPRKAYTVSAPALRPKLALITAAKLPMEAALAATSIAEKRTTVPAVITLLPVSQLNADSEEPIALALAAVLSEK